MFYRKGAHGKTATATRINSRWASRGVGVHVVTRSASEPIQSVYTHDTLVGGYIMRTPES